METIKVVSQPIQSMYGAGKDKPMLKFKDDKGIEYAVFKPELFPIITSAFETSDAIQAEVQVKESTNPNYPYNHNIINIFQDGKPVIQKENKGGGFRGGRSAETETSIERQCCLKSAVELAGYAMSNGANFTTNQVLDIAEGFYQWLSGGQKPTPNAPQSNSSPTLASKPVVAPIDKAIAEVKEKNKEIPAPMNAMTHEAIKLLATDPDKLGIMKATAKDKGWTKGKTDFTLKDLSQVQAVTLLNMFSE